VRVDVSAVEPGTQVEHATRLALGDHDVVECHATEATALHTQARLEQHARLALAAALERVIHALEHALGPDVGQEPEPAAVDAEDRDVAGGGHAGRVQHRAVAADRNQQVSPAREFRLRDQRHRQGAEVQAVPGDGPHRTAPLEQVAGEREHRLRDPRVGGAARKGNGRIRDVPRVHWWLVF
jgi:hypothetical protein